MIFKCCFLRYACQLNFLTLLGFNLIFFIFQIIDDEISADFYLAVPAVVPKIMALKSKLRKKFPKSNRGELKIYTRTKT